MPDSIAPPTPSQRETARLSKVDGCPLCLTYETPVNTYDYDPVGFVAEYVCTDCGHYWFTSWKDL